MSQLFNNNRGSLLAVAMTTGATTLTVTTGEGANFPAPTGGSYFLLTIIGETGGTEDAWEVVRCTARSGDTLTVTRGQDGTTAQTWNIGDKVEMRVTAEALANFDAAFRFGDHAAADYATNTALSSAITGLATVASTGAYADLSGTPALAPVATAGTYASLTGKPALAPVATSGSYTDLSNTPSNVSTFLNDAGYLTSVTFSDLANAAVITSAEPFADSNTALLTAAAVQDRIDLLATSLATVATSGSYNNLTDTPTIPAATAAHVRAITTTQISNWDATVTQADSNTTAISNLDANTPSNTGAGASGTWGISISGNAATASLSSNLSVNYNNNDNGNYQMLYGSGTAVYGTAGVYIDPSLNWVYATNFQNPSDARLKQELYTLDGAKVLEMRGVLYEWLNNGMQDSGVIAQELQGVAPELVSADEDGMLSVNYSHLAGYLIESDKRQEDLLQNLLARVEALENVAA